MATIDRALFPETSASIVSQPPARDQNRGSGKTVRESGVDLREDAICSATATKAEEEKTLNEEIDDLLRRLGERLGLEDLAWDDGGECTLEVDDHLTVAMYVDDADQNLVLYAVVGQADEDSAPQVYRELIEANLLWKGTGGATLGADPDAGTVILAKELPLTVLDLDSWEHHLGEFVSVTERWTARLTELTSSADPESLPPTAHTPIIRA